MRVLVVPMAAMAETSGPFSRAEALINELLARKHEVALCAAEDVNYRELQGVKKYYAPLPSPFGLPMFLGKRLPKLAQAIGVMEKKPVNSYEQVLHFVGATNKRFFEKDVRAIQDAIREFRPDVIYAEFRISAIIAAKLENVKSATGYSYPVQRSFACNPEYSKGVAVFLSAHNLPAIGSVLDIFEWADMRIVPSSRDLEPVPCANTVFAGPFAVPDIQTRAGKKDKIIAYMGNGTVSPKRLKDVLTGAFAQTGYQVYIASAQLKPYSSGNIHIDKRYDFRKIMPEAAVYINHGGQNSIMTGLLYGVPQLLCPGSVFERRYNAASVSNLRAGIQLEVRDFTHSMVKEAVDALCHTPIYSENALREGERLLSLGGAAKAADAIENLA